MTYINAEEILPAALIFEIQRYADGVTLYIPRKAENRRCWGCGTAYKSELLARNEHIRRDRQQGASIPDLAEKYHLSEKSIRRILQNI